MLETVLRLLESSPVHPGALAALGGVALAILALLLVIRPRRRGGSAPRQVRALARQGLSTPEIARRTGLSRDAVALAMQVENAAPGRRNLPSAARIAGQPAAPATFREAMQVASRQQVAQTEAVPPRAARPLPLSRLRALLLFPRTRTAAWASSTE